MRCVVCSMTNACNVCGKTHGHDTSSLAQFSCGCAASCVDAETDHLPSGPIACFLVDFQPVRQDDCIQAPAQSRMPKTSFDACVLCYINAYLPVSLLTIGWQLRAGQRRFKRACHALHILPSLVAVGLLTCVAGKGAVKDRSVVQEVLLQQLWLQCRPCPAKNAGGSLYALLCENTNVGVSTAQQHPCWGRDPMRSLLNICIVHPC